MQIRCFILASMSAMVEQDWQAVVISAARHAKLSCDSVEIVTDAAHCQVLTALLRAFGQRSGHLYAEPRTPERRSDENARPTDCLLLTPELGALLVEVKGWTLDHILRIEAGSITRITGKTENPWKQAQEASGQIQKAAQKKLQKHPAVLQSPYFDWIVAFPHISKHEWAAKGFRDCLHESELLFAEDLADSAALCRRLESHIKAKAKSRVPCATEQLDLVRAALGSSAIRSRRSPAAMRRRAEALGQTIDTAEFRSKRLFPDQNDLAEAEFDRRPQLIRGVAGSGKTTVLIKNLANMVDRQLQQNRSLFPDKRLKRYAVVCYNHSLVPMLQQSFDDAYLQLTATAFPGKLHVNYLNGMLYELTLKSPLVYQPYREYRDLPDNPKDRQIAQHYCNQLERMQRENPVALAAMQYDTIYVDEGQDLLEEEYWILMHLLRADERTGERNLVIAYDDAQNLYGKPRPTWKNLGIEIKGRTAVMKTCYRNTKQIVEFAFNLLLGTAAETRAMTKEFADSNDLKKNNLVEELPDRWLVHFAARTDESHPQVMLFVDREAEIRWLVEKVCFLIDRQEVRPSDILILFENKSWPQYADLGSRIRKQCPSVKAIRQPHGKADNKQKDEYIFEDGALTITTVGAAKGYDCPIVLVVGTDCFSTLKEGRAAFYVAVTRAKMELFITGVRGHYGLAEEAEIVSERLKQPLPTKFEIAAPASTPEMPAFKRGVLVRHPHYGVGCIIEDPKPKFLASQNSWDLHFRVQFGNEVKMIVAGLAKLQVATAADKSESVTR